MIMTWIKYGGTGLLNTMLGFVISAKKQNKKSSTMIQESNLNRKGKLQNTCVCTQFNILILIKALWQKN